jgi:transcriptional regulator with XRE-family HTH domain
MPKKSPNLTDKHVGSRVRMRRMMLDMSQTELGNDIGLTFQQVQKYEKGTNRIGAGRLHEIARILKVPIQFFFEGSPREPGEQKGGRGDNDTAPLPTYVTDFLATSDGLALTKAFMQIKDANLRRRIVSLVQEITGEKGH